MPEKGNGETGRKPWPKDCIWPEPQWDAFFGSMWDTEDIPEEVDGDVRELLDIRDYYDELVEEGRLNADYTFHEKLEDGEEEDGFWEPEKGTDYWSDSESRFLVEIWEEDVSDNLNCLKIAAGDPLTDPVAAVRGLIHYAFINENLLRQAFTRRAFQVEYGLNGCNEELAFFGETALNTVVTQEMFDQMTEVEKERTDAPFQVKKDDREKLSRLRGRLVSGDYLARRAKGLGLGELILYGTGETETPSALENALEALVGAVAADSGWDWDILASVVDKLLCLQFSAPDRYLGQSFYELFHAWHQRQFGKPPEYKIDDRYHRREIGSPFFCTVRFQVPENDRGIQTNQLIETEGQTCSKARERAAEFAYWFVVTKGLWISLKDAGIEPKQEDSINQLQELYQKKFVEKPVYSFSDDGDLGWRCNCRCSGLSGYGQASGKTAAKKKAAYMVLVSLLESAGCCRPEWKKMESPVRE